MMNKPTGYTHKIAFYKKDKSLGWMFCDFPTTEDAVKFHLKSLMKQQVAGTVRNIDVIKLKSTTQRLKIVGLAHSHD